jgi:hypothetical protein
VKFLKESNCVNSSATEKISQDAQLLLDNKFSMLEDLKEGDMKEPKEVGF